MLWYPGQWIVSVRLIGIRHIEVDQIVSSFLRYGLGEAVGAVTMGIYQRNAMTSHDILANKGFKQRSLSRTALSH